MLAVCTLLISKIHLLSPYSGKWMHGLCTNLIRGSLTNTPMKLQNKLFIAVLAANISLSVFAEEKASEARLDEIT